MDMNVVIHRKRARRIWGILKKLVESCGPKKKSDFRLLAEARPVVLWRVPHVLEAGADGKARIERMCISLLMSKNL